MEKRKSRQRQPAATRRKLLNATRSLIMRKGFSASGVDRICADAGVTKGAFFHHFDSKEELGIAAMEDFAAFGMAIYEKARSEPATYPLEHLHRFFDIMIDLAENSEGPLVCVVGMLSQEMASSSPLLREACGRHLSVWSEFVASLLRAASEVHPPRVRFDPQEMAWFLNSLWQGSMLVAKAANDPRIVIRNLQRARAYVDDLFGDWKNAGRDLKAAKRRKHETRN